MESRDRFVGRWECESFLHNFKADGKYEIRFKTDNLLYRCVFTITANGSNGEWWINSEGKLAVRIHSAVNEALGETTHQSIGVAWGSISVLPGVIISNVLGLNMFTTSFKFINGDVVQYIDSEGEECKTLYRRR